MLLTSHASSVAQPLTAAVGATPWEHRRVTGTLYVVGTPIGNLGDLSERSRETLESVDLVVAEDTRRTGRLLAHLGIDARMVSMFEGNERERTRSVLSRLRGGEDVALVSDGGMPLVSDPGYRLVHTCADEGIEVRVVPGPSAVTAALAVAGLPVDRWVFEGFLPRKAGERRARLRSLAADARTIVVFESPRRLESLVRDVVKELGERRIAVARELTKLHEEVIRGRASEVLAHIEGTPPRGEVVVVIGGAAEREPPSIDELVEEARRLIATGLRAREAAAAVAAAHGGSANAVYRALLGPADGADARSPAEPGGP
jgi:16S rRNA (cytidine1402-2'-O)-methyltransferase